MSATRTDSLVELLVQNARQAFNDGNLATARKQLGMACELAPNPELTLALGHMKFSAGGVFEALQDYTQAAEIDPACAAAHASRALALQILGHHKDAKAAAERAVALDHDEPTAARVLARMRLDSQNCGGIQDRCQNILDGYLDSFHHILRAEHEELLCPA